MNFCVWSWARFCASLFLLPHLKLHVSEIKSDEANNCKPSERFRYIDDTFYAWRHGNYEFLKIPLHVKGVLHPSTKISMFCLFSPSSRKKSILFMYGCDRCVWFKVKKHDIFSMDLRISHVERFKYIFSLFNLKNHYKINRINSCVSIVGIIPLV